MRDKTKEKTEIEYSKKEYSITDLECFNTTFYSHYINESKVVYEEDIPKITCKR